MGVLLNYYGNDIYEICYPKDLAEPLPRTNEMHPEYIPNKKNIKRIGPKQSKYYCFNRLFKPHLHLLLSLTTLTHHPYPPHPPPQSRLYVPVCVYTLTHTHTHKIHELRTSVWPS